MQHSFLTPKDLEWLAKHCLASRLGFDFMLSDLLFKGSSHNQRLACTVPIWFEGDYVTADLVVRQVEKTVRYSQIFEQWQARVYDAVMRTVRLLSSFDARVLIVAAGFGSPTADEVYAAAYEAVSLARHELYGDDEDHC